MGKVVLFDINFTHTHSGMCQFPKTLENGGAWIRWRYSGERISSPIYHSLLCPGQGRLAAGRGGNEWQESGKVVNHWQTGGSVSLLHENLVADMQELTTYPNMRDIFTQLYAHHFCSCKVTRPVRSVYDVYLSKGGLSDSNKNCHGHISKYYSNDSSHFITL